MSSYTRKLYRIACREASKAFKKDKPIQPPTHYKSFNIFTKDGQNRVVTSKKPMTLEEAQYYFDALAISGN